jgi:hypothetical protein
MSQTYTADCYAAGHQATTDLQAFEDNFAALKSAFSGTSAPSNMIAGMAWLDTTLSLLKTRNTANDAWRLMVTILTKTAHQVVGVNAAGTDFESKDSLQSLLTATGDIIIATGANTPARLAKGTVGQSLIMGASLPEWSSLNSITPIAGTDMIISEANTERNTNSATYVKVKDIEVLVTGTVTVTFSIAGVWNSGAFACYGKVYKNGVAAGTERTSAISTYWDVVYETFSENFTVVYGDNLQLYYHGESGQSAYAKNFQITCTDSRLATIVTD